MDSILDNADVVRILRKAFKITLDDTMDKQGQPVELVVLDEIPFDPRKVSDDFLLRLPSLLGVLSFLGESCKAEVSAVANARKTTKSRLIHNCLNPVSGHSPISKTTEKAVEAYVESQPEVVDLNMKHSAAKTELGIVQAALYAVHEYNTNLRAYFKTFREDEMLSMPVSRKETQKETINKVQNKMRRVAIEKTLSSKPKRKAKAKSKKGVSKDVKDGMRKIDANAIKL